MMDKTSELLNTIDVIIEAAPRSGAEIKIIRHADGKEYVLESKEAILKILINSKWVGYDLSIKKDVLGKEIGKSIDTDLYPLWGEHASTTLDIFHEAKACLLGFLNHKIYIGKKLETLVLAVPLSDGEFSLTTFKSKKRWWQFDSSSTVIVQSEEILADKEVRPLK